MPSNSRAWFLGVIRSLLKIEPFRSLIVAFEDKLKTCSYFLYRMFTLTSDLRISTRNKYNQFIFLVFFILIGSDTRSQRYFEIWWLIVRWRVGFDLDWICCKLSFLFSLNEFRLLFGNKSNSSILMSLFVYHLNYTTLFNILSCENARCSVNS